MKILLLADIGSSHTEKWALGLASKGIKVGIFSFNKARFAWYDGEANIELLFQPEETVSGNKFSEKMGYFRYLPILKSKLREFKPDILHAHYASSYGLIGSLSKFQPFIISVWGSDVYDFPKKSWLNNTLLKYALSKPKIICSTSECMKTETKKYTSKEIDVIPFGIDVDKFSRDAGAKILKENETITIGNIKSLEDKYGIDDLIKTFHLLLHNQPNLNAQLLIVGDGNKRGEYEALVNELNISEKVVFTGRINHDEIATFHRKIDVFVCLSKLDSESFGVSLVEAMSSKSIVVASKVDGFREVLGDNDQCGYLVEKSNPQQAAAVLQEILANKEIALNKTNFARNRVLEKYDWNENLKEMIAIYQDLIS